MLGGAFDRGFGGIHLFGVKHDGVEQTTERFVAVPARHLGQFMRHGADIFSHGEIR